MKTKRVLFRDIVVGGEGLLRGPFGSDLKKSLYVPKSVNTYKVYLQENILKKDKSKGAHHISKEYYDSKMSRYKVKNGDFIVTCDGTLGEIFQLKDIEEDGIISSSLLRITLDKSQVSDIFFPYFWKSRIKDPLIRSHDNSVLKHLPGVKAIREFEIDLPALNEQKKIAKILSTLDAKIELNNKINNKLESMAKLIYDYWFVQFDFPDENGRPYKSSGGKMIYNEELKREIPEGWKVELVANILANESLGGKIASSEYLNKGEIPIIDQSSSFICGYTNDKSKRIVTKVPRIIFGDHTRRLKLINFDFARGADGTQVLLSKEAKVPQHLFYHCLLKIDLSNYGYARHFKFLKDSKIIIPDLNTASKFEEKAKLWYNLILANIKQNKKLAELRDWLLPMLMNGQVTVK